MRRAGLVLLLLASAAAGALAAVVIAGPTLASGGTTTTGTETTTPSTTSAPSATIAAGVTIGGVNVGGLSPETAYAVVRTAFEAPLPVTLGGRSFTPLPKELGAVAYVQGAVNRARAAAPGSQVDLLVRVRGEKARAYVAKLAKDFDREPVDARVLLRKLRPALTKDKPGRELDRIAATKEIIAALLQNSRFPLELSARAVRPLVTRKSFGAVIVIRRASNRLFLYDGARYRKLFRVATGEARYPTPLGRFQIVVKWRDPWWYPPDSDWARGLDPVPPGPGNPLGTRWMGLSSPGVGIHGTPDPASIGYSVSHGCIRMQIPEAEWLFQQVKVGTPVFIVSA